MQKNKLLRNNCGSYFYYPCKKSENKKGTIVFIHGFATTSEYHDCFIKHINNEYDYYALQLPGHGYEPADPKTFFVEKNLEEFTKYICKLIESLNINDFYLIGHSMGGGLSVRVSSVLKDKIKKLVAVTPMNSRLGISSAFKYPLFNPETFNQSLKLNNVLYHDLTKTIPISTMEEFITNETKYQVNNRKFLVKTKNIMFSLKNVFKCREYEKKLGIPSLIIGGKYDKIIPMKSLNRAFKLKQSKSKSYIQIEVFNESGHLPFQEEEEKYAKVILDFFEAN